MIAACLLATWIVWGSTYLAIKFALVSFPPFLQMGARFLVAGVLLIGWALWCGLPMPNRVQWRNAFVVGVLMLGGNVGGVAYAEQTVASGLAVAFIAVVPALITIASLPFGIRPSCLEVVGIAVGIAGVFLLIRGESFSASPAGLIAMTIAALGWSVGSVLSQHVFRLAPGSAGYASQMICAGVFLAALSLPAGESLRWPPEPLAVAAWLYLVFFGSLIAFTAYMVLLSRTSPATAASYSFVNPVIGMLLGTTLGRETVTRGEWLAVGIVVVGVTAIVLGRGRSTRIPRAPVPSRSQPTQS